MKKELGKISQGFGPFIIPSVRVGDEFWPIRRVEEQVLSMRGVANQKDQTLAERDRWVRRISDHRDALAEENKRLRTEQDILRAEVNGLKAQLMTNEAEMSILRRNLDVEREEGSRLRQHYEDMEVERQRRGYYHDRN